MSEDPLAGGKEVTTQMVGFNKIGDFIKGTYTGKKHIDSKDVYLYEIKGIVGQYHTKDDNNAVVESPVLVEEGEYYQIWGGKTPIDDLFGKSRLGEIVSVQFKEETPSKTKGYSPFKVFSTKTFGPDKTYMGEDSNSQSSLLDGAEEVAPTPAPAAETPLPNEPTQAPLDGGANA